VGEHLIRLRAGWGCRAAGLPESQGRRLALPVCWGQESPRRVILTRRFGRPPVATAGQALLLRMEQVEGLLSLSLNGRPIALGPALSAGHEIELGELSNRNVLVLEVETPAFEAGPGGSRREWGNIALVARSVDSAAQPRVSASPPPAGPLAEPGETT
jgi:hypothetical protein